jgi:hypothetical protein
VTRPGTPSLSKRIECLFKRFPILCHICGERIFWDQERHWDHLVEYADCHDDSAENYAPVHPEPCHKIKSAKAETQRSRIDRLENEKLGLPKRKRPKRKMQSRGFPKVHRPMRAQ